MSRPPAFSIAARRGDLLGVPVTSVPERPEHLNRVAEAEASELFVARTKSRALGAGARVVRPGSSPATHSHLSPHC